MDDGADEVDVGAGSARAAALVLAAETPLGGLRSARIEDLLRAAASAPGFATALEVIQAEQASLMAVLGA